MMPNYKDLISDLDIDYSSAFTKAWIAFNAWYRHHFANGTDRAIIDKIKEQNNRFKTYMENFLKEENSTDEAIDFRYNLKKLQTALVNAAIVTQERGGVRMQISFSEIAIKNLDPPINEDYRDTNYKIQRTGSKVVTTVSKKGDPSTIYFKYEQDTYDETGLGDHIEFQKLSELRQGQCRAFYKKICPYKTDNILTRDRNGNIVFLPDVDRVSRGIVEVLYLLRCSLIHGEVSPDNSSNEVYKYAYAILTAVLKKLM